MARHGLSERQTVSGRAEDQTSNGVWACKDDLAIPVGRAQSGAQIHSLGIYRLGGAHSNVRGILQNREGIAANARRNPR
jgi:hypothetical protein